MDIEARKLKLIEKLKKVDDANLLYKLENILTSNYKKDTHNLKKFSGIWSDKDAEKMKQAINDPLFRSDLDEVNKDFKYSD